MKYHYFIDNT